VISHDTELLEATVNKVFLLDPNRAQIDFYNMDWKRYLTQRETDERARKRERANAEKKAQVLFDQANKMRAKATKAVAAQNMAKRAERLLGGLEGRARDLTAWQPSASRIRHPAARPRSPRMASASPTAHWRSSPTSTLRSTAAPR
jgi:ATPase subunit of ABC transporter with duplicated ATPase domains